MPYRSIKIILNKNIDVNVVVIGSFSNNDRIRPKVKYSQVKQRYNCVT